ncbi:hypothetical protein X759_32340 [Mesorhizobium sp. LSHC420B00]|nr:hypothetical protein X759_32340 [Mesorhizobium sp. LSHC420B00]
MSQTAHVEPPLLSQDSPDRSVNCAVALEGAYAALVSSCIEQGWTAEETATALFNLAKEHLEQLKVRPST